MERPASRGPPATFRTFGDLYARGYVVQKTRERKDLERDTEFRYGREPIVIETAQLGSISDTPDRKNFRRLAAFQVEQPGVQISHVSPGFRLEPEISGFPAIKKRTSLAERAQGHKKIEKIGSTPLSNRPPGRERQAGR